MSSQLNLFDYEPRDHDKLDTIEQVIEPVSLNKDLVGSTLTDLIPDGVILELNRRYETRSVHVGRILDLLKRKRAGGKTVTREEVGQLLSMTWASVRGTLNVMRRMGLVDPQIRITPFGDLVVTHSPYLDDQGLLWLLHFLLASNAQLVLWSNLFNIVLVSEDEIALQEASRAFQPLMGRWSENSINKKVPKELTAILKTYSDAMFSPLRLITKEDKGNYLVHSNTASVPALVWLSIILVYRDRYYPGAASLEAPLITRADYSPGRILRQNEITVRRVLDELHNAGLLAVETRSGLDQVRFKRGLTWLSVISRFLQGSEEA